MPRVPDELVTTVVYLFPSSEAAEAGERAGGTGFLMSIPFTNSLLAHWYVVTNRHVIDSGCRTVGFNWYDGTRWHHEIEEADWERHELGYDVAAAWLPFNLFNEDDHFNAFDVEALLTEETFRDWEVGLGDEMLLVSRHLGHQGRVKNRPIVHSGMLSLSPPDLVYNKYRSLEELSFLVEARSWGGFSGSMVLGYISSRNPDFQRGETTDRAFILGVLWGHISIKEPVRDRSGEGTGDFVEVNSGVAAVVPAWRIREVLNQQKLVSERARFEKHWTEQMRKLGRVVDDPGENRII